MKEAIIAVLTSGAAVGVYGSLAVTVLIMAGKKFLDDAKASILYNVVYVFATKVEKATPEDIKIDQFLDALIVEMEKELGKKELAAIKQVSDEVKAKKQ